MNHIVFFLDVEENVWVCGSNRDGQLGVENVSKSDFPIKHPNLSGIEYIACGSKYTVALSTRKKLYAFGNNILGQLCTNDADTRKIPVKVIFSGKIQSVAYGRFQTLILDASNTVWILDFGELTYQRVCG